MNKEERKLERRFNSWVDVHEKELRILMADPKKWEFCEKHIISPEAGPQDGRECSFEALALLVQMAFRPGKPLIKMTTSL